MSSGESNRLCFECGLCCNGVIFADVKLQPVDNAKKLQSLGLPVSGAAAHSPNRGANSKSKMTGYGFLQPCAAFQNCRCRIYADRPGYCREFDCLTLKQVKAGRLELNAALNIVRTAVRRAETVKGLLRQLGDNDEHMALSRRFRRVKRRLESGLPDDETAELFSRLSLAVHDLNLLLRDAFYPA
jgi:Fe-S-cluster containining protein